VKQLVAHKPEKTLDPYEENTIRGTRMPPWSPLGGEQRDIYGELAWIPNFQVTTSKDNTKMHRTYQEYFDKPKNYHMANSSASAASSDFFKQNAPKGSVARPRQRPGGDSLTSSGFLKNTFQNKASHSRISSGSKKDLLFNATATSAQSYATAPYSTPFILIEERDNRWKVDSKLKETLDSR
jgi:hypothetical protein